MGYRGPDLDLRTPQSWGAPAQETPSWIPGETGQPARMRGSIASHSGPIWVDETVLACCNHAFDLALAHRAAEVRVEHLLHALTRLDAAAEILEARGVRLQNLRRESGTILASEIPVGLPAGAAPRRSDHFEEVLRRASAHAERRYAPAGVEDVLGALLDSDLPGAALLQRNATRPIRELAEPLVTFRRLPPAGSLSVAASNGQGDHESLAMQLIDRVQRLEIGLEKRLGELARTWSLFAERLNSLEHVMLSPRPGEESDLASVHERIGQLEHSLHTGLTEAGRTWDGVADKLKALEASVTAPAGGELGPVIERLDALEEVLRSGAGGPWARLKSIEEALSAQRTQAIEAHASLAAEIKAVAGAIATQATGSERVAAPIADIVLKLQELVGALEGRENGGAGEGEALLDRLGQVLAALEGLAKQQEAGQAAHAKDLKEVHEALMKLNVNQHTLAGSIDQWQVDAAGDLGVIGNRLEAVERESAKPVLMLERLAATLDAVHSSIVQRGQRRNRFRRWLFGTDDWVAASWPSQAQASEKPRPGIEPR